MAVNINRNSDRAKQLVTAQDRPIPIETHGVEDLRVDAIINAIRLAIPNIHRPEVEKPLQDMLEALVVVRDNKSQFDTIRENIEILWNRTRKALDKVDNFSGGGEPSIKTITGGGGTSPGVTVLPDSLFFAYDLLGEIQVQISEEPLTLDTESIKDTEYSHTSNAADVAISETTDYEIEADASFDLNENDIIELKLQLDEGSGFNDIPGAIAYCTA